MSDPLTIRKTYKYRLDRCDKKDRHLRHMIFAASTIWNHFIALQRRSYCMTGQYISLNRMNTYVLKLRHTKRYAGTGQNPDGEARYGGAVVVGVQRG